MKFFKLSLFLILLCLSTSFIEAKTVFRRTDKISENFKQLELTPDEIDPNVAPEPQKVQTLDPQDVAENAEASAAEESLEQAAASNADEVIDESINEIVPVEPEPEAAGAAASVPAPEPAAAAPAAVAPTKAPAVVNVDTATEVVSPLSKYCKCKADACDCCRELNIPLLPIRGPGCARIAYKGKDKMSVSVKYGDLTLAQRTISTKRARPICMNLPGDNEFCGRVYGVGKSKDDFKACLGFEFRNDDEVRAALRVSCFKFGPEGLRVAEAEPLPSEVNEEDDDDDIFGFGAGGDDEDDDDDYDDADDSDDDVDDEPDSLEDDDEAEAPTDADYGGFSLGDLIDELDDDDEVKPSKPAAASSGITPPPAVDQTRTAGDGMENVQSKDDSEAASLPAEAITSAVDAAASSVVTPASEAASDSTTAKPSRTKKSKKSKKKKAVSDTESDFAYELLNGILDFFN